MMLFGPIEWIIFVVLPALYCASLGLRDGLKRSYDPSVALQPPKCYLVLGSLFFVYVVFMGRPDGLPLVLGSVFFIFCLLLLTLPAGIAGYYLAWRGGSRYVIGPRK